MFLRPSKTQSQRALLDSAAFTITELLVAVSLMSLIVLALFAMFNQTQRALRANESQVDSSERGRAVLELVSRELESARVSMRPDVTNFWCRIVAGRNVQTNAENPVGGSTNLIATPRTNTFENVFYLTKSERAWRGVGYTILEPTSQYTNTGPNLLGPAVNKMGTLYRYETLEADREYYFPTTNLFLLYAKLLPRPNTPIAQWPSVTNFSHIADGVVHFKVLPYDTNGRLMAYGTTNLDANYRMARAGLTGSPHPYPESNIHPSLFPLANVVLQQVFLGDVNETAATFRSNALPAYLELELGVLEPDAMRQYNQFLKDGLADQAKAFMDKRLARVQIFRKRIPLRTVAQ